MSEIVVGREAEFGVLEEFIASNSPEFLAIYGGRRVGKTFLIRQFFENRKVIFFDVTGTKDAPMKQHIKHFTVQVGKIF